MRITDILTADTTIQIIRRRVTTNTRAAILIMTIRIMTIRIVTILIMIIHITTIYITTICTNILRIALTITVIVTCTTICLQGRRQAPRSTPPCRLHRRNPYTLLPMHTATARMAILTIIIITVMKICTVYFYTYWPTHLARLLLSFPLCSFTIMAGLALTHLPRASSLSSSSLQPFHL